MRIALALVLLLAACKQSESPVPQTNPNPEPSAAPAAGETTGKGTVADPNPSPSTEASAGENTAGAPGQLTPAGLTAAQADIETGKPWAASLAAIEAKVGARMGDQGDRALWWTLSDGKCHVLSVEKEGDVVGRIGITAHEPEHELCARGSARPQ